MTYHEQIKQLKKQKNPRIRIADDMSVPYSATIVHSDGEYGTSVVIRCMHSDIVISVSADKTRVKIGMDRTRLIKDECEEEREGRWISSAQHYTKPSHGNAKRLNAKLEGYI